MAELLNKDEEILRVGKEVWLHYKLEILKGEIVLIKGDDVEVDVKILLAEGGKVITSRHLRRANFIYLTKEDAIRAMVNVINTCISDAKRKIEEKRLSIHKFEKTLRSFLKELGQL